ncbi:MAG: DNA integrity scanning protein DisA nucleotide-binding domain protein, partial [Planctomycetota bacterium]
LHDGAVVVIGDRIKYAKVFFKFVDSQIPDNRLGARHRAGIYISEQTDAEVFVVSEERNIISHCKNGILTELTI